jgi:hypothetical protein
MRKRLLIGALICLSAATAGATTDCVSWRKIGDDVKRERIQGMIAQHMNSNVSKRYTSEHRVSMQSCLRGFVDQIVEDFDATCSDRRGGSADLLDDVFDRYLLSCVQ